MAISTGTATHDTYGFQLQLDPATRGVRNTCTATAHMRALRDWGYELKHSQLRSLPGSRDMKKRCRKGIPAQIRPWVWMEISGASRRKQEFERTYVNRAVHTILADPDNAFVKQIDLDVPRTFPDHEWFREAEGQAALRLVLLAYASHNPDVGYCQGMNFVAATLLLVLHRDTERTFWVLERLIAVRLAPNTYDGSISGAILEVRVLAALVPRKLPRLGAHMDKYQVDLMAAAPQWFLSLFTQDCPCETAVRVFDAVLHEGRKVLLRVALATLKLYQATLLKAPGLVEFAQALRVCTSSLHDCDLLMRVATRGIGSFGGRMLERLRVAQLPALLHDVKAQRSSRSAVAESRAGGPQPVPAEREGGGGGGELELEGLASRMSGAPSSRSAASEASWLKLMLPPPPASHT